jgi:hypothetical protein
MYFINSIITLEVIDRDRKKAELKIKKALKDGRKQADKVIVNTYARQIA